ncbi:hypothetical protein HPB48_008781 [Haemaphysalis longicornis]|uniref:Uncharacterized protein n=1 Tax=Haemaphysalis longicornis TaxID=44386 RepID=A0A9J6FKE8_HAELO|nr:hypothetical protein HPB48_008781 [Haemaphysalis longicornis]
MSLLELEKGKLRTQPTVLLDAMKAPRENLTFEDTAKWKGPPKGRKVTSACRYQLDVTYYVTTAPQNEEMRRFIRNTLDYSKVAALVNSCMAFFTGKIVDEKLQRRLQVEAQREADLIQLNFMDTAT